VSWKKHILILARVTATSDELLAALRARADAEPATFTFIMPMMAPSEDRAVARARLDEALERLRSHGLEVDGVLADCDPIVAVSEVWDPSRHDEIIVSTLPMRLSKWLGSSLPQRITELTDAPVSHVVSQPSRPPVQVVHLEPPEKNPMGPLSVLGWGGKPHDRPGSAEGNSVP
jgi:hypothetical protein